MLSALLRYWRRLRRPDPERDRAEDGHDDLERDDSEYDDSEHDDSDDSGNDTGDDTGRDKTGRDRSGFRRGSTTYEPREGEDVLADITAKGTDETRGIDRGAGALIVTTKAVVFVTTRKKWRFPMRNIPSATISDDGTFTVETTGGKRFSFVALTAGDKKELLAAIDDAFGAEEDE